MSQNLEEKTIKVDGESHNVTIPVHVVTETESEKNKGGKSGKPERPE